MDWITKRHGRDIGDDSTRGSSTGRLPALLGWSQGALVAQLYAQRRDAHRSMSDLILYGTIYDPNVRYPRRPLYDPIDVTVTAGTTTSSSSLGMAKAPEVENTVEASLEDFTIPGTISGDAAHGFSSLAMLSDPIKAAWHDLHEFDVCDPSHVRVPTLVIVGSKDPYVRLDAQMSLFKQLGTEDKAMYVVPNCDHAVHLLKARGMFLKVVTGFLERNDGPRSC
jgi:pimeloyl-ACP methyl ester carboxylesterase